MRRAMLAILEKLKTVYTLAGTKLRPVGEWAVRHEMLILGIAALSYVVVNACYRGKFVESGAILLLVLVTIIYVERTGRIATHTEKQAREMKEQAQEMRKQTEQQRHQWQEQREATAKPLVRADRPYFDDAGNFIAPIVNEGRPLTDLKSSLVLGDLASAIDYKEKGSQRVEGEISESPSSSRKRDIEAGDYAELSFEAPSVRQKGKRFTLVVEYWDLEGRAYRAAWEFRTEEDAPGQFRIRCVDQKPPERVPDRDRR